MKAWEADCDNYILNQALARYDVPEIEEEPEMSYTNAKKWSETYLGLLNLRSITGGAAWATIYTSGMFNRTETTVFRTVDGVDYVVLQKTLYLDKDIDDDIDEIEHKTNKVISEVLGHEPI